MEKTKKTHVPVSISARHLHLQREHVEKLFGTGYELTYFKEISQPGQYACNEKVTLQGPKGMIENVRVLGPLRKQTQVEISMTDARKLGVNPPVRHSGDLAGSAPLTLIGPKGTVMLEEGCIIADRHIHMTPNDARKFGVSDKQKVSVVVEGVKGGVMGEVTIRVNERYGLDMHIDTDDANAFNLKGNEQLKITVD
ncbi:phosphate propanoyltransferase [Bacillus dakarensis]|uniref:phosphate propanoyltransferase n=1 Tax=Robertmurraya dakarensis TaxID=1926278 RepID=UPI00098147A0|nr:phosphate propanoyltransferase [Bacillus dakarensis]